VVLAEHHEGKRPASFKTGLAKKVKSSAGPAIPAVRQPAAVKSASLRQRIIHHLALHSRAVCNLNNYYYLSQGKKKDVFLFVFRIYHFMSCWGEWYCTVGV